MRFSIFHLSFFILSLINQSKEQWQMKNGK
jgi:hypothetical protein